MAQRLYKRQPSICWRESAVQEAIAVGNPARTIRYRFQPETIARLLTLKWWDWELNKILANTDLLYQNPDTWAADIQFREVDPDAPDTLSLQQLQDWRAID